MGYVLEFEIMGLPKMPNQLLGAHWRTRSSHAAKWRKFVTLKTRLILPKQALLKAKVTCTRFSSVESDFDGLVGSFKPLLDALKKLRVILDDSPAVIGAPDYRWVKASPKFGKIHIKVEEV